MKYLSKMSEHHEGSSHPRTQGRRRGRRRRFTAVLVRLSQTQNTLETQLQAAARPLRSSPPRGGRGGGSHFLCSLPREIRLHCGGGREQKSARTNSLYCNLFYSTFPWRKLEKRINASCFLSVFCSFEQIALAMFLHTVKWNYCLILFFSVT